MSDTHAPAAEVDLLIVGAGFAGLAAARAAAQRGLTTMVAEAKPALGARLHTTGIFVKEAHDVLDLPSKLTRRVTGVRLYGPSRRSVDLSARNGYFLTTDTAGVLRWMGEEAARAGVDIRVGARFEGGAADADGVSARVGGEPVRARWLLGADGARSTVAEAFDLGRNTRMLTGLEREYARWGDLDPDYLHCTLDSRAAPGYIAWACVNPSVCQVGLAVSHGKKPELQPFAEETEARFGLSPDDVVERRAGPIPCGGVVKNWARDRVTLIGDAAGWVSPLTAGGIRLALELGRRAGQTTADHLLGEAPPPHIALAPELPNFRVKSALRWMADQAPANLLFDLALDSPVFRAFARRVYFHHGETRGAPPPEPAPRSARPLDH